MAAKVGRDLPLLFIPYEEIIRDFRLFCQYLFLI